MPTRAVFRCQFCDATPDHGTQRSLQGQVTERMFGEYLDACPGRWLVWNGGGPLGPRRYACREHRGDLVAYLRYHYATVAAQVWKRPPYEQRWPDEKRAHMGGSMGIVKFGLRGGLLQDTPPPPPTPKDGESTPPAEDARAGATAPAGADAPTSAEAAASDGPTSAQTPAPAEPPASVEDLSPPGERLPPAEDMPAPSDLPPPEEGMFPPEEGMFPPGELLAPLEDTLPAVEDMFPPGDLFAPQDDPLPAVEDMFPPGDLFAPPDDMLPPEPPPEDPRAP